ncbi:ABC transporter permease [Aeromonas veronii]|uniref:ABC transporter permease n=1 Tax=Aeromonas veronii TaxID=654 RepID=UPI00191E1436|nr:ABC transporter permease [Aeromonas veronii]MBL0480053.1 ABC transporter permease [Aeromonas veronii]
MSVAIVRALWSYRGFILGNVKREFQVKYQNTLLGAAWNIINPLAMIIVYTVIFSNVMRAKLPGVDHSFAYSIYLCAGVLTWGLFSEIVGRSQNVFLDNANLLKKISFPRLCLPVTVICNALLNFIIVFGIFSLFLLLVGYFPGLPYLALIPVLAVLILFAIGLGITLGVLNVFFRDIGQFFGIALQFWFWLTPIIYPADILPEAIKPFMALNPMAPVVAACQHILVQGVWPQWQSLWLVTVVGALLILLGLSLFRKHAGDMVDEL